MLLTDYACVSEVFRDDDVCDRFKNELDIVRVCGTGYVSVDCLLVRVLVEADESLSQVVDTVLVRVPACRERGGGRGGGGGRGKEGN